MQGATGSIISAVDAGGPASEAGLRPGDVLSAVGDIRPGDSRAFMRLIVEVPVGNPVKLTIWRDAKEATVTAKVAEWPNHMPGGGMMSAGMAEAMIQKMPDPGVRLADLTDDLRASNSASIRR